MGNNMKKNVCVCICAQSCLTLCNPMDCSPPGFSVHGVFQARILEGLPFPTPGDLSDPGTEPTTTTLVLPALAGGLFTAVPPGKPPLKNICMTKSLCCAAEIDTL